MNRQETVALAIGVGYLLGRRRKLGLALALGAAAATGQVAQGPLVRMLGGELGGQGADGVSSLSRLGGAARTALGKPLEMLTERINDSAEALRQAGKPKEAAGGQQQSSEQPQGGEQPQGSQQQPSQQPQSGQQQEAANSATGG